MGFPRILFLKFDFTDGTTHRTVRSVQLSLRTERIAGLVTLTRQNCYNCDVDLRSFPVLAHTTLTCSPRTCAAERQVIIQNSTLIGYRFVQRIVTALLSVCKYSEFQRLAGADNLFKSKSCPDRATTSNTKAVHAHKGFRGFYFMLLPATKDTEHYARKQGQTDVLSCFQ